MPRSTIVMLDDEGRITLPEEIRSALNVESGDLLKVEIASSGMIQLAAVGHVPADQAYFYHPEVQRRIKGAENELRAGGGVVTASPETAQAFLDGLKGRPGEAPASR